MSHEVHEPEPSELNALTSASASSARNNATASNDPLHSAAPLMPLFTPVLQDFQQRYGSQLLDENPYEGAVHGELDYGTHPDDMDEAENDDPGSAYLEQPRDSLMVQSASGTPSHHMNSSFPPVAQHLKYGGGKDDDVEEEEEEDDDSDSRRLLYTTSTDNNYSDPTSATRREPQSINRLSFASTFPSGGVGSAAFLAGRSTTRTQQQREKLRQHQEYYVGGASGSKLGMRRFSQDSSSSSSSSDQLHGHEHGTEHEAPASLLIEMNRGGGHDNDLEEGRARRHSSRSRRSQGYKRPGMNAAELAMWKWVNVENLDNFLARVYEYYIGKGMYTILLERFLRLLLSVGTWVVLLLFMAFWLGQLVRLLTEIPQLIDMWNFYTYLLQIPDEDIQTVSWQEIVSRIIKIRDNNPNTTTTAAIQTTATQRLNAHDIANRIMRKENYMIAMFNKELLDLTIPLPFLRSRPPKLTKILEWSLSFCILGYVFDERGQIRKRFLKDTRREELSVGLRRRFQFMTLIIIVFAPFISIYLILYFFFRYFEEYHKNPGSIGARQYTPLARWKFKEFNELPHLFEARINASYPWALKYMNQFPKEKTILVARFVAFVSGAFAAVLALITIFDQDLLLGLEITPDRTVFFYLGLFGTIMAISRGMIPDETEAFDPEYLLEGVVEYTHYLPNEWRGKLHTDEVRREFASLFEYNVMMFVLEYLSLVLAPLVLAYSLPKCSDKVVDFFREFTVHVDGVGYVCSFAVFDFKRHGNVKYGAPATAAAADERFVSKEGKMEKSFINFKQNNPDWEPSDPAGSMYLSKLQQLDSHIFDHPPPSHHGYHHHSRHAPPGRHGQLEGLQRSRYGFMTGSMLMRPSSELSNTTIQPNQLRRTAYQYGEPFSFKEEDDDKLQRPLSSMKKAAVEFEMPLSGGRGNTRGSKGGPSSRARQRYSSSYEDDDHMASANVPSAFKSDLGDSFVSEIGPSTSGRSNYDSNDNKHQGESRGRAGGDLADSMENERDARKKGVFGLLNQIYEMNNVNM
ncbi:autophagy protein atg9 [Actinomortierella wolfii]|nr:autophagy protein atg9 [Actinomortierella wolfii]